eukprot:scaffold95285_cov29-Tisochrysis_lutea.AAC.1
MGRGYVGRCKQDGSSYCTDNRGIPIEPAALCAGAALCATALLIPSAATSQPVFTAATPLPTSIHCPPFLHLHLRQRTALAAAHRALSPPVDTATDPSEHATAAAAPATTLPIPSAAASPL